MPGYGGNPCGKPRKSAGTTFPFDLIRRRGLKWPSPDKAAADVQAIDAGGTVWLVCLFRAIYGRYPRRFRAEVLYLTPDGMMIRPYWFSFPKRTFRIDDQILDAYVRPYNFKTDWNVRATGLHAKGQPLDYAGFEIISSRTNRGVI